MKKVGEFSFLMTQVLDQTRPQDTKRKENTQTLIERGWKDGGKNKSEALYQDTIQSSFGGQT